MWGVGTASARQPGLRLLVHPWGRVHERWADTLTASTRAPRQSVSADEGLVSQWGEDPPRSSSSTCLCSKLGGLSRGMTTRAWRARRGRFETEKSPSHADRGMVVTNHPLASAAAVEMLAAGATPSTPAIASLVALTVVEPMMVGIFGGGHAAGVQPGRVHTVIDWYTTCAGRRAPGHVPARVRHVARLHGSGRRENTSACARAACPGRWPRGARC